MRGAVLSALQDVLGTRLRGLILKGSAVHGDFIPGYSDVDLHAFVDESALIAPQTLSTRDSLALQRQLGALPLDAMGVSSLQLFVISWADGYPPEWVKPWPGMYTLVYGELPRGFTDVSRDQYVRGAHECVRLFPEWKHAILRRTINSTDLALAGMARELGAVVKPMAFVAATLITKDPRAIWSGPLSRVLDVIEPVVSPGRAFSAFFRGLQPWPPDPDSLRQLIQTGSDAIDDTWAWYTVQVWPEAELIGVRELKPW